MSLNKAINIFLITTLGMMSACSSDNDAGNGDAVSMPVVLAIPASDGPMPTRAGDPGTYEKFKLPRYAYIYIVCKDANDRDVVVRSTPTLDEGKWTKTRYNGSMATNGDSVYQYTGDIHVYLPINRKPTGRVYAAVSTVQLPNLPTGDGSYAANETEATVQDYTYTLNANTRAELANIYSTPYNYRPDGVTYYGTMNDLDDLTPHLDIVLYHVAAKLDLTWNVEQSIQKTTVIKTMTLTLPDAPSSYIFKPLETVPTTTYNETITTDAGNQWYGRASRYVVPMTGTSNTYTFDAAITTASGTRPTTTITAGIISKTQPFTPWMRGALTIRN